MTTGNRLPPSQLAVVQDFLNTRDLASGRDELASPEQMRRWLVGRRLVAPQTEFDEVDRRHMVEVRDALLALVASGAANAFYDWSRNRSARWCSMSACGNRMKGRAYRRRQAQAARGEHEHRPSGHQVAVAVAS